MQQVWNQLVTPNPDIPCEPGWCLQYVRQAFGAPIVEPTATKGWENAEYKHEDYDFPDAWVPLWFSIDTIPEGHVVLRAPDGRIYSTSTNAKTPYVHPNLDHLIWFYGPRVEPEYQLTLRYLGWTEDISKVRVVENEDEELDAEARGWLKETRDRVIGRDAQRYIGPNGEVSDSPQDGYYPARSTDLHDILALHNVINGNAQRILDAVGNIPGIDSQIIDKLKDQLSNDLKEATKNLTITLKSGSE